eukprot:gb/GEZN01011032.1/.p1 GENE.gb/GEZN01011032.1/~~gb/GEZN01011032.1/.p1  ORF type:complete len:289 (-),score=17.89 gb/GEZN01011032.1/:304-1170(-)
MDEKKIMTAVALTGLLVVSYFFRKKIAQSLGLLPPSLHPKVPQPFKVIGRKIVSDNSARPVLFLTLGVPTGKLPTGSHVAVTAVIDGKTVQRSYTPTRFKENACELMLRVYPQGKMSQYLYSLKVGDTLTMRGPTGLHRYEKPGVFSVGSDTRIEGLTKVGMLAGGTGITPMLQIANRILSDPNDKTQLLLLAANSTMEDVMLYEQLNQLASVSLGQLSIEWIISRPPPAPQKWPHLVGRITANILKTALPPPGDDCAICLCGPPEFNKAAKIMLAEIGHDPKHILTW